MDESECVNLTHYSNPKWTIFKCHKYESLKKEDWSKNYYPTK